MGFPLRDTQGICRGSDINLLQWLKRFQSLRCELLLQNENCMSLEQARSATFAPRDEANGAPSERSNYRMGIAHRRSAGDRRSRPLACSRPFEFKIILNSERNTPVVEVHRAETNASLLRGSLPFHDRGIQKVEHHGYMNEIQTIAATYLPTNSSEVPSHTPYRMGAVSDPNRCSANPGSFIRNAPGLFWPRPSPPGGHDPHAQAKVEARLDLLLHQDASSQHAMSAPRGISYHQVSSKRRHGHRGRSLPVRQKQSWICGIEYGNPQVVKTLVLLRPLLIESQFVRVRRGAPESAARELDPIFWPMEFLQLPSPHPTDLTEEMWRKIGPPIARHRAHQRLHLVFQRNPSEASFSANRVPSSGHRVLRGNRVTTAPTKLSFHPQANWSLLGSRGIDVAPRSNGQRALRLPHGPRPREVRQVDFANAWLRLGAIDKCPRASFLRL
jgi:hypothetical protein